MSDDIKDLINEEDRIEIPDEMKNQIMKRVTAMIGESLEFPAILKAGIERAHCFVDLLPIEALRDNIPPEIEKAAEGLDLLDHLRNAQFLFGGMLAKPENEEECLQFIAFVDDENRMGIYNFDKRITSDQIYTLVDELLVLGFQNHRMIRRVLTPRNYTLPEDVKIMAKGSGCRVVVHLDGSYAVDIEPPADIEAFAGQVPEELKGKIPRMEMESGCEDDEPCNCPVCQIVDAAKAQVAEKEGKLH